MSTDLNTGSSVYDSHNTIDSALNTLKGLGRLGDAHAVIDDVAGSTGYEHIDADQTRTADAKLDLYSATYAKNMNTVAQRLNRAAAIAQAQHNDDRAAVFGTDPWLAVSSRDADDRAQAIVNPRDRQAALNDAIANGDDVLARALTKSAIANSDLAAVNTFSAAHPHLDPSLQRLWDSAHQKNDVRQLGLAQYQAKNALRPGAISHLAPFQISDRTHERHDMDVAELQTTVTSLGAAVGVVGLLASRSPDDKELADIHQGVTAAHQQLCGRLRRHRSALRDRCRRVAADLAAMNQPAPRRTRAG